MRNECENNKPLFWKFCQQAAYAAKARARAFGVPFELTAYDIDVLFAKQRCCCAVTGQPFEVGGKRHPFGPSIDRIIPARGYVLSNIRIVTNIVNMAMNKWGDDAFWEMIWWANTQPGKHIRFEPT